LSLRRRLRATLKPAYLTFAPSAHTYQKILPSNSQKILPSKLQKKLLSETGKILVSKRQKKLLSELQKILLDIYTLAGSKA